MSYVVFSPSGQRPKESNAQFHPSLVWNWSTYRHFGTNVPPLFAPRLPRQQQSKGRKSRKYAVSKQENRVELGVMRGTISATRTNYGVAADHKHVSDLMSALGLTTWKIDWKTENNADR